MTYPKRGEIWWTNFDPSVGTEIQKERPAVIVSNDVCNRKTSKVTVVPFTGTIKAASVTVVVEPDSDNNLEKQSLLKIPDLSTFDKSRLRAKMGFLNKDIMEEVNEKLIRHLAL